MNLVYEIQAANEPLVVETLSIFDKINDGRLDVDQGHLSTSTNAWLAYSQPLQSFVAAYYRPVITLGRVTRFWAGEHNNGELRVVKSGFDNPDRLCAVVIGDLQAHPGGRSPIRGWEPADASYAMLVKLLTTSRIWEVIWAHESPIKEGKLCSLGRLEMFSITETIANLS